MRLHEKEFRARNSRLKMILQKYVEFPICQVMGLRDRGMDILEIGCGSGFGATLLSRLDPKNYTGIDLMPEQLELANKLIIKNSKFIEMDASNLSYFKTMSRDIIVIFRILHHMPDWKKTVAECYRVLNCGGKIFIVEPAKTTMMLDRFIKWEHPPEALFSGFELSDYIKKTGFVIKRKWYLFGFWLYYALKAEC